MPFGFFTSKGKPAGGVPVIPTRDDFQPSEPVTLARDQLARTLQQGRFAHILSPPANWVDHPRLEETLRAAAQAIDERFAMVPEGVAAIPQTIFDQPGQPEEDALTEPYLLARFAVTNAEYQLFVDAGGYEELALFPEDVWPNLINFKDQTGQNAPRFWRDGRHDRRFAHHPVVGICYYEASAYAQWAGYRLPTEAEWQMAASWRARGAAQAERRYPWGDGLDLDCCNVWASGHGRTLPVNACPRGMAPNGVVQLIGNVWEWTISDFESRDREDRRVVGDTLLKGVRGGAYDTYFPWQATANFRTALGALTRAHNVGVRCALDLPAD